MTTVSRSHRFDPHGEEVWDRRFRQRFAELGGAAGLLGAPREEMAWDPLGGGSWVQQFERGALCGGFDAQVHEIHGAIHEKWRALRATGAFPWWPTTDELATPDGAGRFNHFGPGASIYWTPQTGAWEVHGAIHERWAQLGWETGFLGYPVGDETDNPDNTVTGRGARYTRFQGGFISWSPATGAHEHRAGTRYAFTVDHLVIETTRTGHVIGTPKDTDVVTARVDVGDRKGEAVVRELGDLERGGPYPVGVAIPFIADDPAAPVVASLLVVNSADGATAETRKALDEGVGSLAKDGAVWVGGAIGAGLGSIGGPLGAGIGAVLGVVAGTVVDLFFANCDGLVVADTVHVSAATLNDETAAGAHAEDKRYPGVQSSHGCGANSSYRVAWRLGRA